MRTYECVATQNSARIMDDLTVDPEPLNPYARLFFGLWGLIVFVIVCFCSPEPAASQLSTDQQQVESVENNSTLFHLAGLSWLKENAHVSGVGRALTTRNSSAQVLSSPEQQKPMSVRFCATKKSE